MGEECRDKITDFSETKKPLHQRSKCQRNILTLKMAKFETKDERSDEQQAAEFEVAKSQENGFEVADLEGLTATEDSEIELRTIKLTESVTSDPEPLTVRHTDNDDLSDKSRLVESEIDDSENPENGNSSVGEESKRQPSESFDHKSLVIWRHPILTLLYFTKELSMHIRNTFLKLAQYRKIPHIIVFTTVILVALHSALGSDHPTLLWTQKTFLWCLYWFSLGMLSSVGLGTGIHTFTLYLGPYIASVTVAETECGYLNFVDDSQDHFECDSDPRWASTVWNIMCKVRLESYMWGLGTAVGELPPYFMGRAARISKQEERTEVLQEFEELERKMEESPESLTRLDRLKLFVRDLVVKTGFWGVLACASIPNPFFDLAGITCGNFLVPFWTFFGATLIGKAVIKTTIQQVFVILSFNKAFLASAVDILSKVPLIGERLQTYFSQYVVKQKEKYNNKETTFENSSSGWFSKAYHVFVLCTTLYCFISIVNSFAQNYHRRLKKQKEN